MKKPTARAARIYFTAIDFGIITESKTGRCNLENKFSKLQAVKWALKAKQAMESFFEFEETSGESQTTPGTEAPTPAPGTPVPAPSGGTGTMTP